MSIELGNSISLSTEEMRNNSRPAIDITLDSAAYAYRDKLIGILLSGANKDGAFGMKRIKERGGLTIVQNPSDSTIKTMPEAALESTSIDMSLCTDDIVKFLVELDRLYKVKHEKI
jgi:two-component system chemotaxis response regulator CheB